MNFAPLLRQIDADQPQPFDYPAADPSFLGVERKGRRDFNLVVPRRPGCPTGQPVDGFGRRQEQPDAALENELDDLAGCRVEDHWFGSGAGRRYPRGALDLDFAESECFELCAGHPADFVAGFVSPPRNPDP